MSFVKWMDKCPLWLKVVLALPALDIIWAIYRIVKGVAKKNTLLIVVGILWIIPGAVFAWLVDMVTILIGKKPILS